MSRAVFQNEIKDIRLNNPENELIGLLDKGIKFETLYNALRDTYLIVYNAQLIKTEQIGSVGAVFRFKDVEKAEKSILVLAKELLGITNKDKELIIDKCLKIVKENYLKTATWEERSKRSGLLKNNENEFTGLIGFYFDFNSFPDETWKEIAENIKEKILKEL